MKELLDQAAVLVGRPVEVVRTKDGKYIVEWLSHDTPPPPKGDTEEAALREFIAYVTRMPKDPGPPDE